MVMICVQFDNLQMEAALGRLIAQGGYEAVCQVCARGVACPDGAEILDVSAVFGDQVRLGAVMDRIVFLAAGLRADREIAVGSYVLQIGQNRLIRAGGEPIVLTDTEARLLCVLAEAGGDVLSRDALLAQVWGYRADIDTHTVETHIYRLRQKIEADPASPSVLVTQGAGYCLASVALPLA